MLKKRIIFSLLYCDGYFVQSRNFNIQKVGDVKWLEKNYDFKNISYYIDELIVLDISPKKNLDIFLKNLNIILKFCFIPISVGGGIDSFSKAKKILRNGADKIVINSNLNSKLLNEISTTYGQQSIIASIDFKKKIDEYRIFINNSTKELKINMNKFLKKINNFPVGEIMLNSIDRDGTGNGLDFSILEFLPKKINKSVIISGGCGNAKHIFEGINKKNIDAVSTANLLNFVGDGLKLARDEILEQKDNLPVWDVKIINKLRNKFK